MTDAEKDALDIQADLRSLAYYEGDVLARAALKLIEAITEQLAAARDDAKEAEAYAEEVEADRKKTYEAPLKVSRIHGEVEAKLATCEKYRDAYAECDRIGTQTVRDLEAKLARAEWLLTDAAVQLEEGKVKTRRNRAGLIWQFLDEIRGA